LPGSRDTTSSQRRADSGAKWFFRAVGAGRQKQGATNAECQTATRHQSQALNGLVRVKRTLGTRCGRSGVPPIAQFSDVYTSSVKTRRYLLKRQQ
jgi:hypothetical protein